MNRIVKHIALVIDTPIPIFKRADILASLNMLAVLPKRKELGP